MNTPQGLQMSELAQTLHLEHRHTQFVLDVLLELQWVGRLEQPEAQLEATYVLLVDLRTEAIEPLFEKLCLRRSDITGLLWQQTQIAQLKLADVVKA